MRWTDGSASRTAAAVPSVEALSTTITRYDLPARSASSQTDRTHWRTRSRVLNVTITTARSRWSMPYPPNDSISPEYSSVLFLEQLKLSELKLGNKMEKMCVAFMVTRTRGDFPRVGNRWVRAKIWDRQERAAVRNFSQRRVEIGNVQ